MRSVCGRRRGLMVSALARLPNEIWVLALAGDTVLCSWAKPLNSRRASPRRKPNKFRGSNLQWASIPSRGSRNTPSRFMMQKPGYALAAMSQSAPRRHFFVRSVVLHALARFYWFSAILIWLLTKLLFFRSYVNDFGVKRGPRKPLKSTMSIALHFS